MISLAMHANIGISLGPTTELWLSVPGAQFFLGARTSILRVEHIECRFDRQGTRKDESMNDARVISRDIFDISSSRVVS